MAKDKNSCKNIMIYFFDLFFMGHGVAILKVVYMYIKIEEVDDVITVNESYVL